MNHTNDGFLNSILNDEDLQLMDMAVNEGHYFIHSYFWDCFGIYLIIARLFIFATNKLIDDRINANHQKKKICFVHFSYCQQFLIKSNNELTSF